MLSSVGTNSSTPTPVIRSSKASSSSSDVSNSSSTQSNKAAASQKKSGVNDNFKAAALERIQRGQAYGIVDNTSDESAEALANNFAEAAAEVERIYGKEAANTFRADVLKGIDSKGLAQKEMAETVSEAVQKVTRPGLKDQAKELTDKLNQDLGDNENGKGTQAAGLSQAMANFYGLESRQDDEGETLAQGFDDKGKWTEVKAQQSGEATLEASTEVATLALQNASSFTWAEVGEEVKESLVNFFREELGMEDTANFLEKSSKRGIFMNTMDSAIQSVITQSPEKISQLEQYLNGEVKTAINNNSSLNSNEIGTIKFEGWSFSRQASAKSGEEGEIVFSSSWTYTNRDDATYTRRSKAAAEDKKDFDAVEARSMAELISAASKGDDSDDSKLSEAQKINSFGAGHQSGDLVNTIA